MSRRPAVLTQADVARVIRAAQQCKAGFVEVKPDGTIRIDITPQSTETQVKLPDDKPKLKIVL